MAIKAIQPRHYPTSTYMGECIQVMQSLEYLGINVSSPNRCNVCYGSRLQTGWNSYYMYENQSNQSDNRGWEVRLMFFNTTVVQVFIYGVEVWGDIISLSARNEIDKIQKTISWELNPQHPVLCFRNTLWTHRVTMQKVYK